MDEEEQFVNIDLNDDNICSVCKLETETGTMSFCHVCFELSIEGVSSATLLHSKSLRGHRDCFEKCHLIANQKLSRSKVSRSAYEGMKLAFNQKLNRIIQYAQNKDSVSSNGPGRRGAKLLCYNQQSDRKLLPQSDPQVPHYTPCWDACKAAGLPDYTMRMLECRTVEELGLLQESHGSVWNGPHTRNQSSGGGQAAHRHQAGRRDELTKMSVDELHQLNTELLMQIQSKCYFLFFFCVKWGKAAELTQPLGHIRLSGPYGEKRCLISQPSQRWSMGLIKLEGFSTQHIMSCYVTTSVELVTVLVHTPPLLSLHPSSLMVRLHQKGSKFSQRLLSQPAAVNSPLFAPVGT
uniref:Protein EURL homolog n=1 Tax=Gasterosteus aculeatus aculeatus TaxID=481459 RepID=A0AAQ4REH0_GASAC